MANGRACIAHITEEHGGEGVCAWRSHTRTEFLDFFVHVMNHLSYCWVK